MRKYYIAILLSIFLSSCYSKTLFLPPITGDYSVGTKSIEIIDSSRKMLRDDSSRKWMVQIFYPSSNHQGNYDYMPGTIKQGNIRGTKIISYAKPNADIKKDIYLPVIIFVPGFGGVRQRYTILLEELASHGFIIFSIDQPYVSNFVKFPNGEIIVPNFKDIWKSRSNRNYRYQYYDEAMSATIKDIKYMIDKLSFINNTYLKNACNVDQIILMGHSFGGNVVQHLGFKDDRVKAVVDIDSKITERKIFGRVGVPPNDTNVPILFIRGGMQYQEDVGEQLLKISNSTIWEPMVEHSAFSDKAYIVANIEEIGNQWMIIDFLRLIFKVEPYLDDVDTSVGNMNINDWYREYRNHVLKWLKSL